MSNMSNLMICIQEEIERGELSFRQIAEKFEVPVSWVDECATELASQYEDGAYLDSVSADADALASAGFGTDEDYGYYGEDY
jgi:predicted XRE-type DNA-binding protein